MEELVENTSVDQEQPPEPEVPETPPVIVRNPWLAGVASLLVPGLGQMYNGQKRNWLIVFIGWPLATNLNSLLILFWGIPIFMPLAWGIPLWSTYDAFRYAQKFDLREYQPFQRRYYYILYVAMILNWLVVLVGGPLDWVGAALYRIPTGAMEKTILVGDRIAVDCRAYSEHGPRDGDVIVYRYPLDPKLTYAKRCLAIPGQWIEIRDGKVLVDSVSVSEPYAFYDRPSRIPAGVRERAIFAPESAKWNHDNYGPLLVPEGKYFVMGDNRDNSADSRYSGFVSAENIIGQVKRIYWSVDRSKPWSELRKKIRWSRIGHAVE